MSKLRLTSLKSFALNVRPAIIASVILFLLSAVLPTIAQDASPPANGPTTPSSPPHPVLSWVRQAGQSYVLSAVPPPPPSGSDREKSDLQAVLTAQAKRSSDQTQEAQSDQTFKVELLTQVLGPEITRANYPVTFGFLDRAQAEAGILTSLVQAKYPRHFPYRDHPEVKNLFAVEGSSYPSLVAAESRFVMLVLAELFPDRSGLILKQDDLIGQSAVNAGVHYPSDVIAAKQLGTALLFVVQENPLFKADLAKARTAFISFSRRFLPWPWPGPL